ncbi:MAG: lipopolysaccharide transport system permease protein [Chloroflexota bacterium]|jgi:ABC-type polysaccharide/polyol phosphate export permease|nr:lipopolysaccharide transport system permease protein [Chloroflexota bacterium]
MHVAQANEAPNHFRSSAARPSSLTLLRTAVAEVLSRRHLIRYLLRANLKKQGTDTILGNVWWLLDPLISMVIYVIVMTYIFQRRTPDFPLFLLAAMVPFKWFTGSISGGVGSITGNGQLIKQIQFPKLVLPLTAVVAELVNLVFGIVILLAMLVLVYPAHASFLVLWIPVIAVVQLFFTLSLAIVLSAVTVFYRDIGNLISHLMRLLLYTAPIIWSFDDVQGRGSQLEAAIGHAGFVILKDNPLAILLESYRHVIYGVANGTEWLPPVPPDLIQLGIILLVSLGLCALAIILFKRLEPAFAKVL